MKKILTFCFILTLLSNLNAFDFGGLIQSDTNLNYTDELVLSEILDTSLYVKCPLSKTGATYITTEGIYRLQFNQDVIKHGLNIPLLKLNHISKINGGSIDLSAGRFPMIDFTGKIFNQAVDGLFASYSSSLLDFSFFAGYTGLINKNFYHMIGEENYEARGNDLYSLALPYLVFSTSFSMPYILAKQSFVLDVWGNIGIQNLKSNNIYGTLGLFGPIVGNLFYILNGSFNGRFNEQESLFGFLVSTDLSYSFSSIKTTVNAKASYASKDFFTISATNCLENGTFWNDIMIAGLSASVKPISKLIFNAESLVALKVSDMEYFGTQFLGTINWQIVSDMAISANAIYFLAKDNTDSFFNFQIKGSISF